MRFFLVLVCVCGLSLQASIVPTFHLESGAVRAFQDYVAKFERDYVLPYQESGKMWMDDSACCRTGAFSSGKPVVMPRMNSDIAGASIHHFSGAIHIDGKKIDDVRRIMLDYPNYPKYFKPDVSRANGTLEPGSTPSDQHYLARMSLIQTTLWVNVSYDCVYDTHYRQLDPHRWESISTTVSIREWRDPKDPEHGTFPEGNDHGFLWRTNTYWFAREANGGIDLEVESMSLSRPVPTGFAWWGTKRTKDAVDKMVRDMKTALESLTS